MAAQVAAELDTRRHGYTYYGSAPWLYSLWQVAAELDAEKSGKKPGPHHAPSNLEMQRVAHPHPHGVSFLNI